MKKVASVNKKYCVSCGACMKVCPKGAIAVVDGCYARVDTIQCVGCGSCVRTCPAGAVSLAERGAEGEKTLV